MRRAWLVVVLAGVMATRLAAQAATTPQAVLTELTGDVVTDVQGTLQPVRRAVVRLENLETRTRFSAVTDVEGRFILAAVPAGRYVLSASSPAYVTTYFGAQRIGQAGAPIAVSAGQRLGGLRLVLPRGGVIAGTVRTEAGQVARGVDVRVYRGGTFPDGRFVSLSGFSVRDVTGLLAATTDGDGRFRLFGLAPGQYRLVVAGSSTGQVMFAAPLYWPGTFFPEEAVPLEVGPGETLDGIDLTLRRPNGQRVSGQVIGPGASGAEIRISPVGPSRGARATQNDGRFTYSDVPSGRYVIGARAVVAGPDGHEYYSGETTVFVGASEVREVQVVMATAVGTRVAGRVESAGDNGAVRPPARVVLRLQPPWQSQHPLEGPVRDDGSFVIEAVPPGHYDVGVSFERPVTDGAPWHVVSVMAGGEEALDAGLAVESGGIGDVNVTVSPVRQQLRGRLRGSHTLPPEVLTMLVYPADRRYWRAGSRWIHTTRPATDGSFVFEDLPAGDYLAITLFDPDPAAVSDPVYLASLVDVSMPVRLAPGEQKVLDVATAP